jgi:predicted RNA-binding protein Jag
LFSSSKNLIRHLDHIKDDKRIDWLDTKCRIGNVMYYNTVIATITMMDADALVIANAGQFLNALQSIRNIFDTELSKKDLGVGEKQRRLDDIKKMVDVVLADFPALGK